MFIGRGEDHPLSVDLEWDFAGWQPAVPGPAYEGPGTPDSPLDAAGTRGRAGVDRFRPEGYVSRLLNLWQKEPPMLLLTRRPREEIVVIDKETGEEIVIAVLRLENREVRIGIEASKRFDIYRREVLERKLAADTV